MLKGTALSLVATLWWHLFFVASNGSDQSIRVKIDLPSSCLVARLSFRCTAAQMFMLRATQLLPHTRHTSLEKTAHASLSANGRHATTFKVGPLPATHARACRCAVMMISTAN